MSDDRISPRGYTANVNLMQINTGICDILSESKQECESRLDSRQSQIIGGNPQMVNHYSIEPSPKDKDKFLLKVTKSEAADCWAWLGRKNKSGYGTFYIKPHSILAHRLSFVLFVSSIPARLCVLHRCDNPSCVNPNHLFLGTHRDNMKDAAAKGRIKITPKRGEQNPMARVTVSQVLEIRKLYATNNYSQKQLAEMYGVGSAAIGLIVRRKNWKYLITNDEIPTPRQRKARGLRSGAYTHPERLARGSANPASKLTEQQVVEIRTLHLAGESRSSLAKQFAVTACSIRDIVKRRTWKHV